MSHRGSCRLTRKRTDGSESPCQIRARWKVGVALRAYRDDQERDYIFENAQVCNRCRTAVKLEDFVDNSIFAYIARQAVINGWPSPRRNLTRLVFEKLDP